jgi:hypothetical protein
VLPTHEAKPFASVDILAHRFPPGSIFQIPVDGVLKTALKLHARSPAELTLRFGCINSITPVMARAIGNEGDKRLSWAPNGNDSIENAADPLDDLEIRALGATTEIVSVTGISAT